VKRRTDVLLLRGDLDRAHATLEFTGFASMLGAKKVSRRPGLPAWTAEKADARASPVPTA